MKLAVVRVAEITVGVLVAALLSVATDADLVLAGWLRGDRVHHYRVGFTLTLWLTALLASFAPRMATSRRVVVGLLSGYFASAFSQFLLVPLLEDRAVLAPIYRSVERSGIVPMLLAPLATFGWAAGVLAQLFATGADALRRALFHRPT